MKRRLFWYTTLIMAMGLLFFFIASLYVTASNNSRIAEDAVMETTQICADLYADGADLSSLVQAGNNTRITVIAQDGAVLAESNPLDVSTMENHLNRPEVQAAANGSPQAFSRHSSTLGTSLIYYAVEVGTGDGAVFIRGGVPVAKIDSYLFGALPPLVLLLVAICVLCFCFTRWMVGSVTKPLAYIVHRLRGLAESQAGVGGSYEMAIPASYEEIDEITHGIEEVAGVLKQNMNALQDEKNKLDYILQNIGDGLFVLDESKDIVLINTAALGIFGAKADIAGKNLNYLSYDEGIAAAVNSCVSSGKDSVSELVLNGHIYLMVVKRLPKTMLTMLVLSDVTENRENAKRREEFFANASHELKTPLTAIRGFSELAEINNQDENIGKYLGSIARETSRMLLLIEDMLKVSEIESTGTLHPQPIALAKVAEEVREALAASIEEKAIAFTISGSATVSAEMGHVYDLIKNLAENAVRYNNTGGTVIVAIETDDNAVVQMLISDDGIGIPQEEQARIFERFYRVEKSRSQKNGGTGLGLSIAKHICVLYGWELKLHSKPGVGTDVTVKFCGED